jgi:hypothetical protein
LIKRAGGYWFHRVAAKASTFTGKTFEGLPYTTSIVDACQSADGADGT